MNNLLVLEMPTNQISLTSITRVLLSNKIINSKTDLIGNSIHKIIQLLENFTNGQQR